MNKLNKFLCAVAFASVGSVANAGYFQLDTGDNTYDGTSTPATLCGAPGVLAFPALCPTEATVLVPATTPDGNGDANSRTGAFTEFGFSQLLGTSIYSFNDSSIFGDFVDTNIPSELIARGVTDGVSGTALDTTSSVTLNHPTSAQTDLDALSPLAPPLNGTDNEGFLANWELDTKFLFEGTLSPAGPVYTGGFFEVWFKDINNPANNFLGFKGEVTGSSLQAANLDISLNITEAKKGFLFSGLSENGIFKDVHDIIADKGGFRTTIDTNVNPPVPTPDTLLLTVGTTGDRFVARQSTLDGSISSVSEPSTLAVLGLGLLAFGASRRRKS